MVQLRRSSAVVLLGLLLAVQAVPARADSEIVQFPVTSFLGETTMLSGRLMRPEGDGPFPALVLLHGGDGMSFEDPWAERFLLPRGYVLLEIDSLGPRGVTNVCGAGVWRKVSPKIRARDAHAGKDYLASLAFVDGERIAVMGWSHGAITVLSAVSNRAMNEPQRPHPFKAAIAFYPHCSLKLPRVDAPLLVLIGDADDWTPVTYCRQMELTGETPHDYQLIVYPGATHAFDWAESPGEYLGHRMIYDPAASVDAYRRVSEILKRYFE